MKSFRDYPLPFILGWDVSGVVKACGAGVTQWKPGDEVYGRPDMGRNGAYAEYIAVPEAELRPGLLFENSGLWETVRKLKAQIGSVDSGDRMYADALGGLLAHEVLRLHDTRPALKPASPGGLAAWQQKRVLDFMEEHLAEGITLDALAALARLSPYHFLRSFKRSFGEPPHRYWTALRIERAKALLANPDASITGIALKVGFSETSAFSAAFHRVTGLTPTAFRRALE